MAYRKDWSQPQAGPMGFIDTMKMIGRVVTVGLGGAGNDNVTGNTIGAFKVPAGFVVTGILAVTTGLDSSTGLTISIGDATLGTRYLSASTGFRSAGSVTALAGGTLFLNVTDTEILITITAQSTTAVAGTIALYLQGFMAQ